MRPRTDRADLEKYHEDLIVCSACIAGEVPSKILHGDLEGAREACQWYHNLFGDDYYLELQRHKVPDDPSLLANREVPEGYLKAVSDELSREPADAFGGPDKAHSSFTFRWRPYRRRCASFGTKERICNSDDRISVRRVQKAGN